MILCDTNIFIEFLNGDEPTLKRLRQIGFDSLLVSSITVIELIKGTKNKNHLRKLISDINAFSILNFNEEISEKSMELIRNYHLSHNLHLADSIIAASSVVFNLELLTYNLRDFKFIENLKLYKI